MENTTNKKTSKPNLGMQSAGHRQVKGSKAKGSKYTRQQFNLELQAKLRRIKGLYECDKTHRETIAAEFKREKESLLKIMQQNQLKQIDLIGTDFYVYEKERSDWTYSDELEDRMEDINADKKKEERKGIAVNEPTVYLSVGHH